MKIREILDKMLLKYYQLYMEKPSQICMNMPCVKNVFDKEITPEFTSEMSYHQSYRGIVVVWDDKEPFIRLEE